MVSVVTRDARDVASSMQNLLRDRDVTGLAYIAAAGTTGVLLAQEVSERVLPMIFDGVAEPATPTQFAVAGGIKLALAFVLGTVGASLGGFAMVFLAIAAAGSAIFGGADFWNAIQRSGVVAEATQGAPAGGGSGNRDGRPPRRTAGTTDGGYDY